MNVLAFLPTGKSVGGVTVPATAIVWWQDRAWVYRRTLRDAFTRAEIATELPAPGGGYIVKDLPPDTDIVTRGAQLLLSEEFRAQIQVDEDNWCAASLPPARRLRSSVSRSAFAASSSRSPASWLPMASMRLPRQVRCISGIRAAPGQHPDRGVGLTPEQVEVLVTRPIENAINGVPGVQTLRSSSIQGVSVVTVFFDRRATSIVTGKSSPSGWRPQPRNCRRAFRRRSLPR